jgi:DNA-binding LytR/AlgR family response regulator
MVDPDLFFRINRNVMVNIEAVSMLIVYSSNRYKMINYSGFNADELNVSRDKVSDFKRWMD